MMQQENGTKLSKLYGLGVIDERGELIRENS